MNDILLGHCNDDIIGIYFLTNYMIINKIHSRGKMNKIMRKKCIYFKIFLFFFIRSTTY
jgi:hypothetical protein